MAILLFVAFLAGAALLSFFDWRRGWMMILVCGVIQDPIRKLTPGMPVVVSFLVIILYAAVIFAARAELMDHLRDFTNRFPGLHSAGVLLVLCFALAAVNGMITFGLELWRVPVLSLFTYLAPLPAFFIGYTYLRREEMLYRLFSVYAALTAVAMIGTVLEYQRVPMRVLGTVSMQGDYIRHLPGIQVRLLSGFYRSPDIMAWHAATLTAIAAALAIRAGFRTSGFIWMGIASGGTLMCFLSGRRKAIYYVVAFAVIFLWRYLARARGSQMVALLVTGMLFGVLIRNLASDESTSVYTRSATATTSEIVGRLEGGVRETVQQTGFLGAGLGMATQGTHHLVRDRNLGWQEGGLAKLTVELGVPGLLAAAFLALKLLKLLLRLTAIRDVEGSSQFVRAMLFALVGANAINFMASAQPYTDAILALLTAFFAGALLATAVLDERVKENPIELSPGPLEPSPA